MLLAAPAQSRNRRSGGDITSPLEDLVGAPLPVGPESDAARQASAYAASDNSPIGR